MLRTNGERYVENCSVALQIYAIYIYTILVLIMLCKQQPSFGSLRYLGVTQLPWLKAQHAIAVVRIYNQCRIYNCC